MIYQFGKIKKKNWEASDFVANTSNGKEFHNYYQVIVGNDDVHIKDTCGRSIPISKDHISALINVLLDIEEEL